MPFSPVVFDAHSGPSGEDPSGTVSFTDLGLVGQVNCLAVGGNRATIGVLFDEYLFGGLLSVEDNDGAGADIFALEAGEFLPDCSTFPTGFLTPIVGGDIVVTDVSPLPTSKDQCKNGGWRNYPGFKNQGQCLVFVLKTRLCQFLARFGHHPRFCPARLPTASQP